MIKIQISSETLLFSVLQYLRKQNRLKVPDSNFGLFLSPFSTPQKTAFLSILINNNSKQGDT